MIHMRRRPSGFILATAGLGLLFLILPILIIVPLSLSRSQYLEFPPAEWSVRWYGVFFTDPAWMKSLATSCQAAVLATLLAVLLSTMAAVAIVRMKNRFSQVMLAVLLSPMIVPGLVTAIALYGWLGIMRLTGGFAAVVIGHALLAVPFTTISVMTSLIGFNPIYERASLSLGATPTQTFFRVILPNILPGIVSGTLIAFVTSFDDVIIALFLGGRTMTLSRKIWEDLVVLVEPTQAAASTIILAVSIIMLTMWSLIQGEGRRKAEN